MKMFVHTPTACFFTSAAIAKMLTPGQSDPSASSLPRAFHDKTTNMVLKNHPSTPINMLSLAFELSSHPNPMFVNYLLK